MSEVIAARIEEELGLHVPVVLRSSGELAAVMERNPFLDRRSSGRVSHDRAMHVMFLRDEPLPELVETLDPERSPPDEYAVIGREVYLLCPNGVARSKLTNAWVDRKLRTVSTSTSRNWRTVRTLHEMAST